MKRWLPHPILTPALAVIWLLLNNSFAPGQILLGLLLGWSIPLFTLAFWPERDCCAFSPCFFTTS